MSRSGALCLAAAAVAVLLAGTAAESRAGTSVPHIRHVFIVVLENEKADVTFGKDSPAPYLSKRLPSRGLFAPNYYGIGHLSLGNYIAMISGQAPNPQTQSDCQYFTDFLPGTPAGDGQLIGSGCVYPDPEAQTIADQLEETGGSWKGYMEDMGTSCRHPDLGARDDTQHAEVGDQYAARHNPFVYFHSIIDSPSCAANDVDLGQLRHDLEHARTTADYNLITPNLCNDGHDEPCVDGAPGGLEQADGWLRRELPQIFHSPAYRRHGLVIVTFDEAEFGGAADAVACCGEPAGPNTPNPGIVGPGGGRIGAVMLSPCIAPGTTTKRPYNHYSMLRSIEDNFGLPHLGFAGRQGLRPFGSDVLNHPGCGERIRLSVRPRHLHGGPANIHFRVRSRYPRCYRHVLVKLIEPDPSRRSRGGGRHTLTDASGRARIKRRLEPGSNLLAVARHRGCIADRAHLRVR